MFYNFIILERKKKNGFTLMELLVVISIIVFFSTIILAAINGARNRAAIAEVKSDLSQFIKAAVIAQGESGKPLLTITGQGCSSCVCRDRDTRNLPESDACYINWVSAIDDIENAGGVVKGLEYIDRDPWGSPYYLDENEREGSWTNCTLDNVRSVGKDGYFNTSDDISFTIPHHKPCP